jgi:hypothetical protein
MRELSVARVVDGVRGILELKSSGIPQLRHELR